MFDFIADDQHDRIDPQGRMLCQDCGRHIFYDRGREDYRHVQDSERECFLIPAESRTSLEWDEIMQAFALSVGP